MKNREQLQQKVETGKIAWSKRLWLAWLALLGTLSFGNITEWIAQESILQERENDWKEIVIKTPAQVQNDSEITLDKALNILNKVENQESDCTTINLESTENWDKANHLVDYLMWLETVKNLFDVYDEDYIRETLNREISQALKKLEWEYSDEFINKSIEEILNNSDIFYKYLDKVIRRCVSDTDFQDAIKNWENDKVKKIIKHEIWEIERTDPRILLWCLIIALVFGVLIASISDK